MKISIVIPAYNRYEGVKKCVESIQNKKWDINYEVVIVSSSDDVEIKEYLSSLKEYSNIIVVYQKPMGACKALIEGLKYATGDYYITISDDCLLVNNQVIDNICKEMEADEDIGMYGVKNIMTRYPDKPQVGGRTICGYRSNHFFVMPMVLIRSSLAYDECFYTYGIDADQFYRGVLLGYKVKESEEVGVIHDNHIPHERGRKLAKKHRNDTINLSRKWGCLLDFEKTIKKDEGYNNRCKLKEVEK